MSVCIACGAFLVYLSEFGDSRKACFEDWANLSARHRALLRKTRRFIMQARRRNKPQGMGGSGVDFGI